MTHTEQITRMCELSAAMADLEGQARKIRLEMDQLINNMREE